MIKIIKIDKNIKILEEVEILNKLLDYSIEDYFVDAIKEGVIIDYKIDKYQNYIEISTYNEQKAKEYFIEKGFNKISWVRQLFNGNRPTYALMTNNSTVQTLASVKMIITRNDGTIEYR